MTDPKTSLLRLNENLNILKERKAKYAGNAPLELLNQIDDHRKAIDLTRQVITGELNKAEWQEALKPLLLAFQKGQVVNIRTETYIAGDVKGDIVSGDKIITHIYAAPPPQLSPPEAKDRHNLNILLNKVKTFWIEGVLEKSVHNITLIELGKETQTEAVSHAWEQVLELPDQSRQTLPPDMKIGQIFDEMNRALLILGAPGSGKTITLLQLARDLITQAEQDKSFARPVPVVFNLSSWSKGISLLDWLVSELSAKYQIPKRVGQSWLADNRLLPLLDGLDEVKPEDQAACVETINRFGEELGLAGVVVCSRLKEYINLPVRLKLNGAIRLQPLTLDQVYGYLTAAGDKLGALLAVLQEDEELQDLARSPLTLGIMSLAYLDLSKEDLVNRSLNTSIARRQHLFDTYVQRMFKRKGKSRPYSDDYATGRLTWLAKQMKQHNQSIFLLEQLQPNWLSTHLKTYILISRLISGLMIGLIAGPMGGLVMVGTVALLTVEIILNLLGLGLTAGLVGGLVAGSLGGLMSGFIDIRQFGQHTGEIQEKIRDHNRFSTQFLAASLVFGVSLALINLITAGSLGKDIIELTGILLGGIVGGLMFGLIFELSSHEQGLTEDVQPIESVGWSWGEAQKGGALGFAGGFILGSIAGATLGVVSGVYILSLLWPPVLILGIVVGLVTGLVSGTYSGLTSQTISTKTTPNQGIRLSLINACISGLAFGITGCLIGGGIGLAVFSQVFGQPTVGLLTGLLLGAFLGLFAIIRYGGLEVIRHYLLRLILWHTGCTPFGFVRFLDYAADRIFLQKVGGGYIFIHRLLLEHFAAHSETK